VRRSAISEGFDRLKIGKSVGRALERAQVVRTSFVGQHPVLHLPRPSSEPGHRINSSTIHLQPRRFLSAHFSVRNVSLANFSPGARFSINIPIDDPPSASVMRTLAFVASAHGRNKTYLVTSLSTWNLGKGSFLLPCLAPRPRFLGW
jgi:hypothetical protein